MPAPRFVCASLALGLALACVTRPVEIAPVSEAAAALEHADLVVLAERVVTLADDGSEERGYSALAIRDGKVVALGSRDGILRWRAVETRIVDLPGSVVYPGFVDAHAHLTGLGATFDQVDLTGARGYGEVIDRVARRAAEVPRGSWVLGRGWDQNLWPDRRLPTHEALSREVPDHPVWLRRVGGHAALANAKALALAGVSRTTVEPEGGRIHRDRDGEPTGLFIDNAMSLVSRYVRESGGASPRVRLLRAQEACLEAGITRVHDAWIGPDERSLLRKLAAEGVWKLGVYAMLGQPVRGAPLPLPEDSGPRARLRFTALKIMLDGALGSRGAALLEPYDDEPGNDGKLTTSIAELRRLVASCARLGVQPCVHAIGDRANRAVLDAYAELMSAERRAALRPRVEHAQVLAPSDLPRFAELGVVASMQPTHLTTDMAWAPERLGAERVRSAYAFRTLGELGAHVCFGSDFPVEPHAVVPGIFAAVTTRPPADPEARPLRPDQCLDARSAILGFTREAAYAAREEGVRGRIAPGFEADLTVLDRDLTKVSSGALLQAHVLATIVKGEPVYIAGQLAAEPAAWSAWRRSK